jgi:histone deacetylase 1/2
MSSDSLTSGQKRTVAYFNDIDIGNYQYVAMNQHPLKPHRVRMTDALIKAYNLDTKMKVMKVEQDYYDQVDLTKFHSDDYIDFLSRVTPDNKDIFSDHISRFNFGEDCPVFLGLYDYCKTYSAGSVLGADYVINGESDISINWSGGLHHAKK